MEVGPALGAGARETVNESNGGGELLPRVATIVRCPQGGVGVGAKTDDARAQTIASHSRDDGGGNAGDIDRR